MSENDMEIGGMTYGTYSIDRDPSGAIGIALADAKRREEQLERTLRDGEEFHKRLKYQRFVEVSDKRGVSVRDFSRDETQKRKLLESHFSGRFGKNGNQRNKFVKYSSGQVGALFARLYEEASKY